MSLQNRFKKPRTIVPISSSEPRMLSPKAAGIYIGQSVDKIYEMIQARKIRVINKGSDKRPIYTIDRHDLNAWIDANKMFAA